MGRTVHLESYVERIFSALSYGSSGILLGQTHDNKDYVVLACECPPRDTSEGNAEVHEPLDKMWMSNHCRNLLRMLPGGLTVCGIFWVAKSDSLKGKEADVKEILASLHRCEKTAVSDYGTLAEPSKTVILIDPNSKKLFARNVMTDSPASLELRPADVRIQSFLDRWLVARSTVDLNLSLTLPPHQNQSCFSRRLVSALKPFMEHILRADGRISGAMDLDTSLTSTQGAGRVTEVVLYHCSDPDDVIQAAETEAFEDSAEASSAVDGESTHCVRVSGKIPAIAVLHNKAVGTDAVKALKTDIIRSLCGRIALLLEELEVTEEVEDFHVEQTLLPQRVLVRLPRLSHRLILSDYKFHSETRDDVVSRVVYFCGLEALHTSDGTASGDREDEEEDSSVSSARIIADGIGLEVDLDLEQCYPPELSESDVDTLASEDERMVERSAGFDWKLAGLLAAIVALVSILVVLALNS